MQTKAIIGYCALIALSFFLHAFKPANTTYYSALPVFMLAYPIIVGHRVKLSFAIKDIILGLVVSVVILIPYYVIFGENMKTISISVVLFQMLGISLPEEFFFRGYLQDSTGRNFKAVMLVSLLFTGAHLPKALFLGDWMTLLTFFPSLVMGWLYMRTNNILPGTIFHFLSNLAYQN